MTGKNPSEPPYEIYPIRYWNPRLSSGLEAIILKCTRPNPGERFQSCAELSYALQHYEEYTAQYRAKQLAKVWKFGAAVAAAIIFIIAGCVGLGKRRGKINSDFEINMNQAVRATDEKEKLFYYKKAIGIKPGAADPYLGIVKMLKEDMVFDVEEEEMLKKLVMPNQEALKREGDYAELAFEIGKLYWYYYSYGTENQTDNTMFRRGVATEWFSDAVNYGTTDDEFYLMASVYRDIGEFNSTIELKIIEGNDGGAYKAHWTNLREMVSSIDYSTPEVVELEIYNQFLEAVLARMKGFRNDGVSYSEVSAMYDRVVSGLQELNPISEMNVEKKEAILTKIDMAKEVIETNYNKGGKKTE